MASLSKSFLKARTIDRASLLRWVPGQLSSSLSYSYSSTVAVSEIQPPLPTPPPPPQPQPTSSSRPQEKLRGWTRFLLFVPGAITFGLGTWQIIRRQEKVKMLEYKQSRLEMEPINCNYITPSGENLNSLEFRRVVCKGVFDEAKSIYVGPRSRSISGVTENGYYLITPLMPLPSSPESLQMPIIVNRGWVPRSWRDKSLKVVQEDGHPPNVESTAIHESSSWWRIWSKKPNTTEKGQIPEIMLDEIVGVIRGSEKPSIFVPANDPTSFQWFYIDVGAIARTCGLPENTIYIEAVNENVNPSNPYPIPKDNNALIRSSVMPQDHLNYTLTWYSLSAAVTFMAFKRLQPKKKMR
ncbi:surfeit locus protein 1-like isoform X1 [Cynara cardunculus var. scolymus]|uniref:surfeit locus protein 1-like isoform X1 n=1 Tax=Cynara cardunculus var. scolymus TaxID=59895 RepID=UPI000D629939|nr:surfeit locus protein 1-like isoform X1 [Cynara cardunculus var. scolymus]